MIWLVAAFAVCILAPTVHCESAAVAWCYDEPSCNTTTWPFIAAKHCNGTRQSPINIVSASAAPNSNLTAFTFHNYSSTSALKKIENTGETVKVIFGSGVGISGGDLSEAYDSLQFHLHWGNGTSSPGSEHTVDGKRYPMELHIVNIKSSYKRNTTQAVEDSTGLAALGFFIEEMSGDATGQPASWHTLTSYLTNITHRGENVSMAPGLSLDDLLVGVDRTRYYRYHGSLTTPGCHEAVVWTVFKDSIKVSKDLINLFSTTVRVSNSTSPFMVNIYRNIQAPLQVTTQRASSSSGSTTCYSLGLITLSLALGRSLKCLFNPYLSLFVPTAFQHKVTPLGHGQLRCQMIWLAAVLTVCVLPPSCESATVAWCFHHPSCDEDTWPVIERNCNGTRQSPINIVSASAAPNSNLTAFTFHNYSSTSALKKIENTGTTVKVTLGAGVGISGGDLSEAYDSLQFHLHWGNGTSSPGSEHTVNGKRYPMELHIVNSKSSHQGDTTQAVEDSTGLAALGFFIEEMSGDATGQPASWHTLTSYLANITHSGENVLMATGLSLDDLLVGVDRTRYYRYHGSLTTPGCHEAVVWTVFKDSIKVSKDLINLFSTTVRFSNSTSPFMVNVYRNIQAPLPVTTQRASNSSSSNSSSSGSTTCYSLGLITLSLALGRS
ncbi:carbonic anhydrase XVb [Micropterus salmoides]|uniref:carbonic anhydrase XVb n=1 Tax=Micropterus salmoides TaxID=27706 RepID=UPI0018EBA32F|nr:carbonic anhydrase XVb [Micropterus salmoides]